MKVSVTGNTLRFFCPGCNTNHSVNIREQKPTWTFNNDFESPTLTPSILVRGIREDLDELPQYLQDEYERISRLPNGFKAVLADPRFNSVCHSFITGGKIQYLTDCTHTLAGATVELPSLK